MTAQIRKAQSTDLDGVVRIYEELHDAEEQGSAAIGWIRGVYPTRATAKEALLRGDLFVLEEEGCVLGAAIINQVQVDSYEQASWEHDAEANEVCVLHTLVISPQAKKRGFGTQFVTFYEEYARKHGCRELRIDTNERNHVARAMYQKLGYQEVAIIPTTFNGIPDVNLVLLEKWLG